MDESDDEQEYLKQIIREYEHVLPEINEQLQSYKSDYSTLKREIVSVTKENKNLAEKMELCSSTHIETSPFSFRESDLIDNLKNQLNRSLKEKDSVVELWRTALTRIDYLESELKIYSAGSESVNKTLINKMKKTYQNELTNLREQLKQTNCALKETTTNSKTSLANKTDELEMLNKSLEDTYSKVAKLENDLADTQKKLSDLNIENAQLQESIHKERKTGEKFRLDSYDSKLKVAEACHVIEAAMLEKDAAIMREKEAVDEAQKLAMTINEIVHETETKVKAEIFAVKEEFANKLHNYKLDLKKSQDDLSLKTIELNKRIELCNELEGQVEQMMDARNVLLSKIAKERQIWNGKVEQNKEKNEYHERKNQILKQQLIEIVSEAENEKKKHADGVCKLRIEKKQLETQVHSLENELEFSNSRFQHVTSKMDDLTRRLSSMDVQFKAELALKTTESDRILSEKLNEVEMVNARMKEKLKTQLSTQINMNQKWKSEIRTVTEKLEARIRILKTELITTCTKNMELVKQLEISERDRMQYKENLKELCTEFNALAKNKIK